MQLSFSQQMKMSQQMKLAPRMIQSMEILQLPVMALQDRIAQELSENVCLEDTEGDPYAPMVETVVEDAREDATEKGITEKELVVDDAHNNEADFERLLEISQDWPDDNYSSGTRPSPNRVNDDSERQHDLISNVATRPQSLQEYLL